MKRLILMLSVLVFLVTGCGDGKVPGVGNKSRKPSKVLYGSPVKIQGTVFSLIPVRMISDKDVSDSYYQNEDEFGQIGSYCHNFIFYDEVKNESRLLIQEKAFARISYEILEMGPEEADAFQTKKYIVYRATKEDTNIDGVFDGSDASRLFVSNESGTYFKAVTPEYARVLDWQFERETGYLNIRVMNDTDENDIFDLRDAIDIYRLDFSQLPVLEGMNDSLNLMVKQEEKVLVEEVMIQNMKKINFED